jgi:hypothetical protein
LNGRGNLARHNRHSRTVGKIKSPLGSAFRSFRYRLWYATRWGRLLP